MGAYRSETHFPSPFSGVLGHIEKPPYQGDLSDVDGWVTSLRMKFLESSLS
jgi:hypothetical protein